MFRHRLSMKDLKDGAKVRVGDAELTCIVNSDGIRVGGLVLLIDAPDSYQIDVKPDDQERKRQV